MENTKNSRSYQLLNRKKTDPNKFIFTGIGTPKSTDLQLFRYNDELCEEFDLTSLDDLAILEDKTNRFWLNLYGLSDVDEIASICRKLKLHDLVIQDILDVNQRPKFQEFDDYCFFTIKSINTTDGQMVIEQISFVFSKNILVSFQERKGDHFGHLRFRLRENSGILRQRNSDYLLYTMLEAVLDNYFKTLFQLESDVDDLLLVGENTKLLPALLEKIERYKKQVHLIKKAIQPIKDFSLVVERGDLKYIESRHLKYFAELKDLCLTLLDTCENLEKTLESNTNLFFSVQGHRMNEVMKTLTVVTTIFIPLTFIAGIYGMNFVNMPELNWKYGYFGVWALMLMIIAAMIFYFRKKKWF